mgnify:CR=1 FL=1
MTEKCIVLKIFKLHYGVSIFLVSPRTLSDMQLMGPFKWFVVQTVKVLEKNSMSLISQFCCKPQHKSCVKCMSVFYCALT